MNSKKLPINSSYSNEEQDNEPGSDYFVSYHTFDDKEETKKAVPNLGEVTPSTECKLETTNSQINRQSSNLSLPPDLLKFLQSNESYPELKLDEKLKTKKVQEMNKYMQNLLEGFDATIPYVNFAIAQALMTNMLDYVEGINKDEFKSYDDFNPDKRSTFTTRHLAITAGVLGFLGIIASIRECIYYDMKQPVGTYTPGERPPLLILLICFSMLSSIATLPLAYFKKTIFTCGHYDKDKYKDALEMFQKFTNSHKIYQPLIAKINSEDLLDYINFHSTDADVNDDNQIANLKIFAIHVMKAWILTLINNGFCCQQARTAMQPQIAHSSQFFQPPTVQNPSTTSITISTTMPVEVEGQRDNSITVVKSSVTSASAAPACAAPACLSTDQQAHLEEGRLSPAPGMNG